MDVKEVALGVVLVGLMAASAIAMTTNLKILKEELEHKYKQR